MSVVTGTKTKSKSLLRVVVSIGILIPCLSIFAFGILPLFSKESAKNSSVFLANERKIAHNTIIGPLFADTQNEAQQVVDGVRIKGQDIFEAKTHRGAFAPNGPLSNGGSEIPCLTYEPLANASIEEISRFFSGAQYECYYHAWTFDSQYSPLIFSSENVTFIARQIQNNLTERPNQTAEVQGLIDFLHIAYYLQFHQQDQQNNLNFLFENEETLLAVKKAMRTISTTQGFFGQETESHARSLYAWTAINDILNIDTEFLNRYDQILENFILSQTQKSSYYYNNLVNALLISYTRNRESIHSTTLSLLRRIGSLAEENFSGEGLKFRSLLVYQSFSLIMKQYHDSNRFDQEIRNHIQKAYDEISQRDISYLSLLQILERTNRIDSCALVGLPRQCFTRLIPEIKRRLFPFTYEYDNGTIRVHTPLPQSKIDPLYFAAHEVQGGFHRITQTIVPVEGDAAGILDIYIYGSRKEYVDYQYFLFDINSVNNGGIYIEENAQFFTYDRTPQESIYSLQELFRHEYSHYLVGRYFIHGLWGRTPLYEANRMVWVDEGIAEFLAGSTQDRIVPRRVLVEQIARHEQFMNISDIVSATYNSGFSFYAYSGLFFLYLSENQFDLLQELIQIIRSGDVNNYDAFRYRLANDQNLNSSYHEFLESLVNELAEEGPERLTNPITVSPPWTTLSNDIKSIQMDLNKRTGENFSCVISGEKSIARFSCRTTKSSVVGATTEEAWRDVQRHILQMTSEARLSPLTNMQNVVCRMGPFQAVPVNTNFYLLNNIFCDGPLGGNPPTEGTLLQKITSSIRQLPEATHARCHLENRNVRCDLALTTWSMESREQIQQILQEKKTLFIAQLYASHPSVHKNFSCNLENRIQYMRVQANNEEYGIQNMICRWR